MQQPAGVDFPPRRSADHFVSLIDDIKPLLVRLGHCPEQRRQTANLQAFAKSLGPGTLFLHRPLMADPTPQPLPVMPAVLVLEDNEAYRTLIVEVMSQSGFEVYSAPDGRRVPAILREHRIDVVITDLSMPERDGLETLTDLRYSHPTLPVIAISGDMPLNRDLYLRLAEKLGATRVLAKPFKMDQLIAAAREALLEGNTPKPKPGDAGAAR